MTQTANDQSEATLVIDRTFDAPRDLVFEVWTEAEHLAQWWGPREMPITVLHLDVRDGGTFHYSMALPDGGTWYGVFRFIQVSPPERLQYINSFADENGKVVPAPFDANFPAEVLNTFTFDDQDGKTTMHMTSEPLIPTPANTAAFRALNESMQEGFGATFDQLEAYLARVS